MAPEKATAQKFLFRTGLSPIVMNGDFDQERSVTTLEHGQ